MAKFELGQTVVTRGVDEKMKSNDKFRQFVIASAFQADGAGSKRRDSLPQGARHGHWRIER